MEQKTGKRAGGSQTLEQLGSLERKGRSAAFSGKCSHRSDWGCTSFCVPGAPTPTQLCETDRGAVILCLGDTGQGSFVLELGMGRHLLHAAGPSCLGWRELIYPFERRRCQAASQDRACDCVFSLEVTCTHPHLTSI